MALTKGNREKVTTVSSIQSRMGVVGTEQGDALAIAADAIGKNLDIYAQRMITIEEERYKADFQINTINKINQFARDYRLDPTGFTNATQSYIDGLVSKAPQRFKNWSKQYASLKAAQEGDVIFNNKHNADQINAIKENEAASSVVIDDNLRKIYGMGITEFDNYWQTSLLPELGELHIAYENLYNSLDPQYRSGMMLPEERKRKFKVAFEGARFNSKIKDLLDVAIGQDQADYLNQKIPYGNGNTNLENAVKEIKTELIKQYINDPSDPDSPFAVLTNTSTAERQDIADKALDFIDSYFKQQEKLQNKIETQQQVNIDDNFNRMMGAIQNFQEENRPNSLAQLNLMTDQMGFSKEQKADLTREFNIATVIENYGTRKSINLDSDIGSAYRLITDEFGYTDITLEDIKKKIVDYKVLDLINSDYVPEEGMPSFRTKATIDFSYDIGNDVAGDDLVKISQFASNNGVIPSELNEFINSAKGLNYKTEADRMQLAEIAYTVNYLTSRAGFAIDGLESEMVGPLMDLHDMISKMPRTQDDPMGISEQSAFEYFFAKINKDSSMRDEVDLKIDSILVGEDIDMDNMILEAIEDEQKKHFGIHSKTPMGITTEDYLVEPLINWGPLKWLKVTSDDLVQQDIDIVKEEITPLVRLYLNNHYIRPEEVNKYNVEKYLKEAIKMSFTTLGNRGYGVE